MSETAEALQRKINSARELKSVVRTMKSLAALSIVQYERSVHSLADYYRAVELGLAACFRNKRSGDKAIWAIGERIYARLQDAGLPPRRLYSVPNSVAAITPLISKILTDHKTMRENVEVYIFHNQPRSGASYEPAKQRLLPLDEQWQRSLSRIKWPTKMLPQLVGDGKPIIFALIREYLFVSLFKACAESLMSENASRLAAMQRAQRNIDDLLQVLQAAFHQKRQTSIDAELFDVISGFEVLATKKHSRMHPE
jgi:F-type H+-transporting ATPase subunit gamma